jgi:hypothetical protein
VLGCLVTDRVLFDCRHVFGIKYLVRRIQIAREMPCDSRFLLNYAGEKPEGFRFPGPEDIDVLRHVLSKRNAIGNSSSGGNFRYTLWHIPPVRTTQKKNVFGATAIASDTNSPTHCTYQYPTAGKPIGPLLASGGSRRDVPAPENELLLILHRCGKFARFSSREAL